MIARVIQALLKVAVGTAFYVVLALFAQFFPTAAGMMLTFPALNGLALAAQRSGDAAQEASETMLFLPVLNCLLCAAYVFVFPLLKPNHEAWGILAALFAVWLVVSGTLVWRKVRITGLPKIAYVLLSTLVLSLCAVATLLYSPPRAVVGGFDWNLQRFFIDHLAKFVFFAACLLVVVTVGDFVKPRTTWLNPLVGVLGGFPLVPFFGLYAVSTVSNASEAARIDSFTSLAIGVWLGPVIAFAFILLFPRFLQSQRLYEAEGQWVQRFSWALPFWLVCLIVIVSAGSLIDRLRT